MRGFAVFAMLGLACAPLAGARAQEVDPAGAIMLVAAPRLVDPDYRATVLLAVPDREQPARRRHHQPAHRALAGKPVSRARPVQAGSRAGLFRRPDAAPGDFRGGATGPHSRSPDRSRMMKELFLATQGAVVDHIIEADAQLRALLRRLRGVAARRTARGDRPRPVVRARRRSRPGVPQGSDWTVGGVVPARAGGDRAVRDPRGAGLLQPR